VPLVYVHGVATRRSPDSDAYERAVRRRDALFRRFTLPRMARGQSLSNISNPYWGDCAAEPAWAYASIPTQKGEKFGRELDAQDPLATELVCSALDNTITAKSPLVDIARRDGLPVAIDLITSVGIDDAAQTEGDSDSLTNTTALCAVALDIAKVNPKPHWLEQVEDDAELLESFRAEVEPHLHAPNRESFGSRVEGWSHFREGVDRINDVVPRLLSQGTLRANRLSLQRRLTHFLGDVFVYLRRGERGECIARVIGDHLASAANDRTDDDPFILIAHSMGGNICYDLLASELRETQVDIFVTVGSQVGYFEELKLFRSSDDNVHAGASADRVQPPKNVRSWLNVYDLNDPLAFAVEPIFAAPAKDFYYSTGEHTLAAHGAYWLLPSFYVRLGNRLSEFA
jgi:hypothetical protein